MFFKYRRRGGHLYLLEYYIHRVVCPIFKDIPNKHNDKKVLKSSRAPAQAKEGTGLFSTRATIRGE